MSSPYWQREDAMNALAALESLQDYEDERGRQRWVQMLQTLRDKLHSLPHDEARETLWRRYFDELTALSERVQEDRALKRTTAREEDLMVKRFIAQGYIQALVEKDERIQSSDFGNRDPERSRVVFRTPLDLLRAVREREG